MKTSVSPVLGTSYRCSVCECTEETEHTTEVVMTRSWRIVHLVMVLKKCPSALHLQRPHLLVGRNAVGASLAA